tara:strand:- start:1310 stop:3043 length:1734 start_codon:yes stop_codon:yes gene_type:complete
MPFGRPPLGGPLGRTRSRISASSLTKYLRCKRQWFLSNKLGISSPRSVSQIIGIVLEDSLCSILMRRPVNKNSLEDLRDWCYDLCDSESINCHSNGMSMWDEVIWKKTEQSWNDVEIEMINKRLKCGINLFLEEVKKCYDSQGGPYLSMRRLGKSPHHISSPAWGDEPKFPVPEKVRNFGLRSWAEDEPMVWAKDGAPIEWCEAWELARPWMKDPRVHQPQRLFHPDGWAAGELDMVLRWDGRIRILDVKSGNPSSKFAVSLEHQLKFYSWLWNQTHDGNVVDGIEGWYLDGGIRIQYEVEDKDDIEKSTLYYKKIHKDMQEMGEGPVKFPGNYPESCKDAAGCFWCHIGVDNKELEEDDKQFFESITKSNFSLSPPSQKIGTIQSRVNIKGKFTGQWGPLPNHYSEPVLGAMVTVSGTQITIEESEPNSYPELHKFTEGEVMIKNALPGVWRGKPRLYVDHKTEIISLDDETQSDKYEVTRIGLMRTKANVEGIITSIDKRSGVRLDEKPWSMVNFHIWDGEHAAEVVAFGSSITNNILEIKPGDKIKIIGAELGWRSGIPQLRIDQRSTRIKKIQ